MSATYLQTRLGMLLPTEVSSLQTMRSSGATDALYCSISASVGILLGSAGVVAHEPKSISVQNANFCQCDFMIRPPNPNYRSVAKAQIDVRKSS